MKLVNLIPLKEIDFRNQDQFDAYIKQHELRPDTKVTIAGKVTTAGQAAKNSEPVKGASVFGKDAGGSVFGKVGGASADAKKVAQKPEKTKYDDDSYWKGNDNDKDGSYLGPSLGDDYDDDDYDDSWSDEAQFTADELNKVEDALTDTLNLKGSGFSTSRQSGGGGGGWEGPMSIAHDDADWDGDYADITTLSVGSPENDGRFTIGLVDGNGESIFEKDTDSIIGNSGRETVDAQQAYKITKSLFQMPEVQKLLKGEMSREEFKPIYDKLKAQFLKNKVVKESTIRLKSFIKRNK
jgi:hypothetical protein